MISQLEFTMASSGTVTRPTVPSTGQTMVPFCNPALICISFDPCGFVFALHRSSISTARSGVMWGDYLKGIA